MNLDPNPDLNPSPDPSLDPSPFFRDFKDAKKLIFFSYFLLTYGTHRHSIFSLKNLFFC
jgi:hypothetical protein